MARFGKMANRDAVLLLLLDRWTFMIALRGLKGDPQRDTSYRFVVLAFHLSCELRRAGFNAAMWSVAFEDFNTHPGLDLLSSPHMRADIEALIAKELVEVPTIYDLNYTVSWTGAEWLRAVEAGKVTTEEDGFPEAGSRALDRAIDATLDAHLAKSNFELRTELYDISIDLYRETRETRIPFIRFDKKYVTFDAVLERHFGGGVARSKLF